MCNIKSVSSLLVLGIVSLLLGACSSYAPVTRVTPTPIASNTTVGETGGYSNYSSRLPKHIDNGGQKTVLVDPNVHAWGAYGANGNLERAGLATAGGDWCPDIGRPCRTKAGTFRINSLGSEDCISHIYPMPRGGAPMPYCMFFNGGQGLHGSDEVVEGNISHGCVRMSVSDAQWLRYNFANVGTKVVVKSY